METASTSNPFAGPANDVTTPGAYEDDARHFAITASQVPKPAASLPLSPPYPGSPAELNLKDVKSIGTRFHEECHESELPSPRLRSSRLYKGKGKEAVAVEKEKRKPLRLLDLPVDILKDIVKEVTHTNDLTSLALCHSALHRLAIPHIYSRFDIVWPDTTTSTEPRSGVDALTYGLATLVMAEEIFGEAPAQQLAHGNRFAAGGIGRATDSMIRRRRGNHYAQFTRKFSLGNGPVDWVQEYLITKEGGKMLGTLVALAVARMRTLETFVWDMPTGILRDVWLALSSLGDRNDGLPCRLEKVWVRWHDNTSADTTNPIPPPPPPMAINPPNPTALHPNSIPLPAPPPIHHTAFERVEHPSFSALPALKSLSVLDIDELAYLDEMAVLLGRSVDKLRELRIGIARHALARDWVAVWDGDGIQQVDHDYPTAGSVTIGERRLGGVLGVLTGFVCDIRQPTIVLPDRTKVRSGSGSGPAEEPQRAEDAEAVPPVPTVDTSTSEILASTALVTENNITSLRDMIAEVPERELSPLLQTGEASPASNLPSPDGLSPEEILENDPLVATSRSATPDPTKVSLPPVQQQLAAVEEPVSEPIVIHVPDRPLLDKKLRLESLELERVPISVPVMQRAIDWTQLTSLTLLHCTNNEALWKTLRRSFAPTPKSPTYPHARKSSHSSQKKSGKFMSGEAEMEYSMRLRKVHTNNVSPSLISFLKETLAPNSLEVLFLQEARGYNSPVTVDSIFRGPLRRHRNSLRKVLIDSSEKGPDGLPTSSSRWRRWILNRDILSFLCGGKMPALRELGMAVDYRDWHFFLQRLPSVPHLRSLYIPFLADHVHGTNVDPRELALQVVDIVALRPEVELCYMGIANKCFEILENKREWDGRPESRLGLTSPVDDPDGSEADDDEDDDEEAVEDEEDEDEEDEEDDDDMDDTETEDDDDDDDTNSEASDGSNAARLRLREILFYDDKVAIFKARHGRL